MFLWALVTYQQRSQIVRDPYELQDLFSRRYQKRVLFRRFAQALFPDIHVSCEDTAPWFIVALLIPTIACDHLSKRLLKVTSLEYLYYAP